ncbi:MAG: tripartite tricarboxylate transporter permease [Firmicutes bacterium]|nr:tripartite tricarboxylate transporter permease [Bacillota bacterium]MCL5040326.1 tripartite tricarboxylate transporter permease [Bacillota bacterium]
MSEPGILSALFLSLAPANLLACLIGAVMGTLVGVLPGLGPAAAMALVLPATFRLGPTAGLIMLAGIYYGSMYGGSTTSILVNVPGEPASVVTAIDGYQMARKGRAGAALAISAIGSFIAGTITVIALQIFAPLLANVALAFGPAEYFSLTLLGLIVLSNLTGKSRVKSLLMVAVGLMISTIGMDPLGGVGRFTFNYTPAQGGLSFIAVTAGLFGVAEVLSMLAERETPREILPVRWRELYPSREEFQRSLPPIFRGTVVGFLVGLIPGPAATIASFTSYGLERRLSRHRDEFGQGAIEAVAGPESANNAATSGGMVPLLSLGLPFTPATAVLLSGMLIHGITPGPLLLRDHPNIFWAVIGSFYLGNIMLLILNLPLVGLFANVARIPPRYLMPAVLVLCIIGAYSDNNSLFDVWVMLAAGIIGYLLRHYDYEPAPLVLGLVLGPVIERSLLQALTMSQGNIAGLWASPISATLLVAAAVAALWPLFLQGGRDLKPFRSN